MTRTIIRQQYPTLQEILATIVRSSAEHGWTLRHAMNELHVCLADYHPVLADGMDEILTITKANEEEADARDSLREQAEEWEGRNNG